jgi:Fe-S oxidoreductase
MGLEQYEGDINMCCRCSACKFIPMQVVSDARYSYVCPSIARYNFHAFSGGGRLNIASAMLKNKITYNSLLRDIVYNCQMCGACGVSCNYAMDMEVLQPINEFRIKCVEDGQTHPTLEKVISRLRKTNSLVSFEGKRGDWAKKLDVKNAFQEPVEVLFHVGCLTSCDKDLQKLAKNTVKILQNAGINFGIAGDHELCCGGRAYQMGYKEDFLNQARKNINLIKRAGINTLVTGCADCYQAFKVLYGQFDLNGGFKVFHITEYLDKLIQEKKIKMIKKLNLNITYHDPCHLGRLGEPWVKWEGKKIPGGRFMFDPPKEYRRGTKGIYEAPRNVINSIPGLQFTEMARIKEYAWCCGTGGGVNESNPEFAEWTATKRITEAIGTGAEAIVSACPWCEKNFSGTIRKIGSGLKVFDIVELVEKAI